MAEPSTPSGATSGNEKVGFCKPPKASQWKPGQSGNPKGKVKGTKSLKTVLLKEASGKIIVKEGGKTRTLTKLEAMVMSISSKGLHGDVKAATFFINLIKEHLPAEIASAEATLATEDVKILKNHGAFLALLDGAESDGSE